MAKIGLARLKKIIKEELENLQEGDDHKAAAAIVSSSEKLLSAIESFRESASEKMKSEISSHLDGLETFLKRVVEPSMQYVDATEPPKKVVSLRPQKKDVV